MRSLRNCFKSCTDYILFHQTCLIWTCQNIKIIKLKVNFVHFIELLIDINKQTLFTSVSYKRLTNYNNNNNKN